MGLFRIVIGLGNPGPEYEGTRHNIGFDCVTLLASESSSSPHWIKKFGGALTEANIDGEKLIIFMPLSFMNLSGGPTQELMHFYKVPPEEVIVVHDDLDTPFGSIRVRVGGGDGGHNGIKSISSTIGREYARVKLGIGRPVHAGDSAVTSWVLGRFTKEEKPIVVQEIERGVDAIKGLLKDGVKVTQNRFN